MTKTKLIHSKAQTRYNTRLQRMEAKVTTINDFISANKSTFQQGADFTAAWLDSNLAWLVPGLATATNPMELGLRRVSAYTQLNRILAFRGLYIKSSAYYTNFHVLAANTIKKQAKQMLHESTNKEESAVDLINGQSSYKSKWRKMGTTQISHTATRLLGRLPI